MLRGKVSNDNADESNATAASGSGDRSFKWSRLNDWRSEAMQSCHLAHAEPFLVHEHPSRAEHPVAVHRVAENIQEPPVSFVPIVNAWNMANSPVHGQL